ncbi:hypothetical protein NDU88_008315 [Pleurodeles waltl]|uniref:Uncharacterized protein n=1 Tax=Pleurodeles waltl TaxID=8319 RepID=A0AAV7N682_PLEWA|nr:hypothetical protein NDU88_008315 [Pleurodeles waltl]
MPGLCSVTVDRSLPPLAACLAAQLHLSNNTVAEARPSANRKASRWTRPIRTRRPTESAGSGEQRRHFVSFNRQKRRSDEATGRPSLRFVVSPFALVVSSSTDGCFIVVMLDLGLGVYFRRCRKNVVPVGVSSGDIGSRTCRGSIRSSHIT